MKYVGEEFDEFERLFDFWNDEESVFAYLTDNRNYLKQPYFEGWEMEEVGGQVIRESLELEHLILHYTGEGFRTGSVKLQMLFRPLYDTEFSLRPLQRAKAKIEDRRYFPRPIVRLYGIRIGSNTYVISGGAIKLVREMQTHPDTANELQKLEWVRTFLKENNFNDEEDFKLIL